MNEVSKKVFVVFAMLVMIPLIGAGCSGNNGGAGGSSNVSANIPADAQSSPEKVVDAFYAEMAAGRTAGARTLIKPGVEGTDAVEKFFSSATSEYEIVSGEATGVSGDWVSTKVKLDWNGTPISGTGTVKVEEIDGKWWIVEIPST